MMRATTTRKTPMNSTLEKESEVIPKNNLRMKPLTINPTHLRIMQNLLILFNHFHGVLGFWGFGVLGLGFRV